MCEVDLDEFQRLDENLCLLNVLIEKDTLIANLKKERDSLKALLEEKTAEAKDSYPETEVVEIGGKMVNRVQSARRVADLIDALNNYPGDAVVRILTDSGMNPIAFVGAGFDDSNETRFQYVVVLR